MLASSPDQAGAISNDELLRVATFCLRATRSNEGMGLKAQLPEATLCGRRATELICWEYTTGRGVCACAGACLERASVLHTIEPLVGDLRLPPPDALHLRAMQDTAPPVHVGTVEPYKSAQL